MWCGVLSLRSCPSWPRAEKGSGAWCGAWDRMEDMEGGNPGTDIVVIGVKFKS